MKLRPNAGFLPALVAGGREQKRKGGPIHMGSENRPCLGSPAFPPATKAEPDTFDLRLAWLTCAVPAGRPAGESEGGGTGAGSSSPPNSGDPSSSLPAEDEGVQPTEEELKVPRIKQLSDEAAKWRNRFREAEKALAELTHETGRADTAEANSKTAVDQLRDTRMENAFLKVAFGKVADVDAAWKLADKAGVTITTDGTVEGLDEVLTKVLEKHPYLAPKPADQVDKELVDKFPALTPSGRPNNGRKNGKDAVDYEKLARQFPALRGRR